MASKEIKRAESRAERRAESRRKAEQYANRRAETQKELQTIRKAEQTAKQTAEQTAEQITKQIEEQKNAFLTEQKRIVWTKKELEYLARINDKMENGTTEEKRRAVCAWAYLFNSEDDGRFGRIEELLNARSKSRKSRVSAQGKTDNYIKIDGRYYDAESKINGGRIESLLNVHGRPAFVIYTLDIVVKHKDTTERRYAKKVIPTALFINFLINNGLTKSTNGKNPEMAIQCSSKKLFTALLNYPIDFIPDYEYSAEDFDGLELYF